MGVDYSPVGGIGIKVSGAIKKKLLIASEGDSTDMEEVLDELGLPYSKAGNGSYTGEEDEFYLLVEGENLTEVNGNARGFIKRLGELGVKITEKDLLVIQDLHVW